MIIKTFFRSHAKITPPLPRSTSKFGPECSTVPILMCRISIFKTRCTLRSVVLDFLFQMQINETDYGVCVANEIQTTNSTGASARTFWYYEYYTEKVFLTDPVFIAVVACIFNRVAKFIGISKNTSNRRRTLSGNSMKSDLHKSVNDAQSRG